MNLFPPPEDVIFSGTDLSELKPVLDVLLAHVPTEEREARITAFSQLVVSKMKDDQDSICPDLFHWKRNGKIVAVIYLFTRPDGTGFALPPAVASGEPKNLLRLGYAKLCELATMNQSPFLMILVDGNQEIDQDVCLEFGIHKMSDLLYLISDSRCFFDDTHGQNLQFTHFQKSEWDLMVETVEKTYFGSQDFPELNGISSTNEILEGYIESHPFDPELWFFVEFEKKIIGVLLLTQLEESDIMELTYLGLFPEYRGRKLSREIINFAQKTVVQYKKKQLLVSVDAKNAPAVHCYLSTGFREYDRKEVLVKFFK